MQNELLLNIFIMLLILLPYIAWRKYSALNARQAMADSLDTFLSSDAPDEMKLFAYKFFHTSLFFLFSPIMTFSIISSFFEKEKNTEPSKLLEKIHFSNDEQMGQFKCIMEHGVTVVLKRAPITTFICLLVLLIFSMLRLLLDKLPLKNSILAVEESLNKTVRHF